MPIFGFACQAASIYMLVVADYQMIKSNVNALNIVGLGRIKARRLFRTETTNQEHC